MAEPIRQMLRERGLRATHARVVLLEQLEQAQLPVSATAIASRLERVCDRPTVYRNLSVLAEAGLIEELGRAAGQTWFQPVRLQRAFDLLFVCTVCVRAFPIEAAPPTPARSEWSRVLREADLLARGICHACREETLDEAP